MDFTGTTLSISLADLKKKFNKIQGVTIYNGVDVEFKMDLGGVGLPGILPGRAGAPYFVQYVRQTTEQSGVVVLDDPGFGLDLTKPGSIYPNEYRLNTTAISSARMTDMPGIGWGVKYTPFNKAPKPGEIERSVVGGQVRFSLFGSFADAYKNQPAFVTQAAADIWDGFEAQSYVTRVGRNGQIVYGYLKWKFQIQPIATGSCNVIVVQSPTWVSGTDTTVWTNP
jgi:hypothetical protein